ncbi:MAG: pyrroloquinoline quinone-dependent dehydrogenase [Acidobacteria bacterium]|nr:pyrroloquinoline quinone-dependent dehydrogenase [Acidobacteriota bacterium]MBV9147733.1 pyrroloquinoline quinone-dependent dehydrogenase [Acidobacteriota bacterium]MBV9436211.1 pyrroloquinoline quinone-dependent dehydrogenase [Acidobacteriota bacterium]
MNKALTAFACLLLCPAFFAQTSEWPNYGNDAGGMRHSPLSQINSENVTKLQVAWTFHTGDISDGKGERRRSGFETTPIMVDGTLYLTTPFNRIIALDPETGKQRWAFDPKIDPTWQSGDGLVNRGVSIWRNKDEKPSQPCVRRIFETTIDARLVVIDAATGKPCTDFGTRGEVSLRDVSGFHAGWYHMTSPPAVVDDIVIVGSAIDDNSRNDMPSGVVRGFDVRTGKLLWSWDPIPQNASTPNSSANTSANAKWKSGAANAWSIMTVDPERHLIFVPTGSASPDFFGGDRPGDNKWANSVVALRAATGELVWGFQLVHHDLWDYDVASPPLLATLEHDGKKVPAVIIGDKTGFLFVLDRDTGKPIFPVEERSVPKSDIPEERASPTQPFPVAPPPLVKQKYSADDAWGINAEERDACRKQLESLHLDGIFTPPSVSGTLSVPGNIGGMNWSGYAFDPNAGLLFANVNNLPFKVRLIPRADFDQRGKRTNERISEDGEYGPQIGAPYAMFRRPLFSPKFIPCIPPPWGTLTAVDMMRGTIKWQVPLGSWHEGLPPGNLTLGGPIVTAGKLVFVAGTALDPYIRAFDAETGKELWKAQLPAPGHATPMTYEINGKQYVVIAAGGHAKIEQEPLNDALIAFALP